MNGAETPRNRLYFYPSEFCQRSRFIFGCCKRGQVWRTLFPILLLCVFLRGRLAALSSVILPLSVPVKCLDPLRKR